MKKYHGICIIAAHGAYSKHKFKSFKEFNSIVFDAQGLTYDQINNLNKIGLTTESAILTKRFEERNVVTEFDKCLLQAIRGSEIRFPLVNPTVTTI